MRQPEGVALFDHGSGPDLAIRPVRGEPRPMRQKLSQSDRQEVGVQIGFRIGEDLSHRRFPVELRLLDEGRQQHGRHGFRV